MMQSASARQRRATIPLSNKSFDAIGLGTAGSASRSVSRGSSSGAGETAACLLLLPSVPGRRGSFLYRSSDSDSELSPMSLSRKHSAATSDSSAQRSGVDDVIVTPFAQILHSLRTVRDNYVSISRLLPIAEQRQGVFSDSHVTSPATTMKPDQHYQQPQHQPTDAAASASSADEHQRRLAVETLEELEWCLDQLETMQTHRSVADMAAIKFKRLLNRELHHFSGTSHAGSEISEYICNTFLDVPGTEVQLPTLNVEHADGSSGQGSRRPSKLTIDAADETVEPLVANVADLAAAALQQLEPEVDDAQLAECMEVLHTWGPDIFHLSEVANGNPLTPVTYTIFKRLDAARLLRVTPLTLVTYLTLLERHYRSHNSYHNCIHAADVVQSTFALLGHAALQNVFTDIEMLATIFAAAVHDVDHPGVTSQYIINTGLELAVMYNDHSVLENHHLAVAFKLLQHDGADIFENLTTKTYRTVRRLAIDIVLSTDMSKHMTLVADLKTMVETRRISGSHALRRSHAHSGSHALLLDNYDDRIQILKTLVHCADLSNPTKPLYLYRQWTDRIMEEFFRQGDLERDDGLEVSAMCDRYAASVDQTQVSFIDYVVHPLWETWAELVFPDGQEILDSLESNREWYASRSGRHQTSASEVVVEEDSDDEDNDQP